jgi:hypothetical protein
MKLNQSSFILITSTTTQRSSWYHTMRTSLSPFIDCTLPSAPLLHTPATNHSYLSIINTNNPPNPLPPQRPPPRLIHKRTPTPLQSRPNIPLPPLHSPQHLLRINLQPQPTLFTSMRPQKRLLGGNIAFLIIGFGFEEGHGVFREIGVVGVFNLRCDFLAVFVL